MKNDLYGRAYRQGGQIVADIVGYADPLTVGRRGQCDGCGGDAVLIDNYGCGMFCGDCLLTELVYCENRWESVTEGVLPNGDYWFRGWDAYPRVYGVIRAGVFDGIAATLSSHTGVKVAQ